MASSDKLRRFNPFRGGRKDAAGPSSTPKPSSEGLGLGLKVVAEGEHPVVDIVAAHGLNGHRDKTWTAANGTHWLRDLLPAKISHARILCWGYDANTHGGRISCQYLYDHATQLVSDLCLERKLTKTTQRPIIFVAHSLGGIIVKSALIHSDAARKGALQEHRSIKTSTYGIVFMGTPHQGGNGVSFGKLLINVVSVVAPAKDGLMKHLERDSEWLQQQLGQFGPISSDFVTKFAYEEYETPTILGHSIMVVPRASAVVPGVADAERIVIHADHINMVKFGSSEDSGYKTISGHLQIMAESAGAFVSARWAREKRSTWESPLGPPQTETRLPSTVVHIKARDLGWVKLTDNITTSWQGYWHEDRILPASESRDSPGPLSEAEYQSLWRGPEHLVQLATVPSVEGDEPPNAGPGGFPRESPSPELLLKLAEFMTTYQSELIAQLELFPNIYQQRALFGAMLRMTNGDLEKDGETGRTLLHWFAMNDVDRLIPKLVDVGFGVNDRDSDYRTPLHLAVVGNNYRSVKTLINECHADANLEDLCYLLPWHHALAIDYDNIVENEERVRSKANIIAFLAQHTDMTKIKGIRSLKILKQLQNDPNAEVVFTLPRSSEGL